MHYAWSEWLLSKSTKKCLCLSKSLDHRMRRITWQNTSVFGRSADAVRAGSTNENQWGSEAVRGYPCVRCIWHFTRLLRPILKNLFPTDLNEKWKEGMKRKYRVIAASLTCKLKAGSAAQDGAPRVESSALVHATVLVLVQVANDQAAPRHATPVVVPRINECSV